MVQHQIFFLLCVPDFIEAHVSMYRLGLHLEIGSSTGIGAQPRGRVCSTW